MHRVLGISTDYAFCLHSKERVPYHIVIKVALEGVKEDKNRPRRHTNGGSQDLDESNNLSRSYDDDKNSSSSSSG